MGLALMCFHRSARPSGGVKTKWVWMAQQQDEEKKAPSHLSLLSSGKCLERAVFCHELCGVMLPST